MFTGQSKIISKNNEIGILLASLSDGKIMKEMLSKEMDTVLQLLKSYIRYLEKVSKQKKYLNK